MAGGRERRERTQRPWSVYRANTFELSSEMIGLALAGEESQDLWKPSEDRLPWSLNVAGLIPPYSLVTHCCVPIFFRK